MGSAWRCPSAVFKDDSVVRPIWAAFLEYCPQPGLVRQMEEAGVVASKSDMGRNVLRLLSRLSWMDEQY